MKVFKVFAVRGDSLVSITPTFAVEYKPGQKAVPAVGGTLLLAFAGEPDAKRFVDRHLHFPGATYAIWACSTESEPKPVPALAYGTLVALTDDGLARLWANILTSADDYTLVESPTGTIGVEDVTPLKELVVITNPRG